MNDNIRTPNSRDERPNRESRGSRADRDVTQERAVTGDREITDTQRLDMLRASHWQEALPSLPDLPGFHVCWLTTANPRDPIHGRMRLGYIPIKASEIPGWQHTALNSGEWAGCVSVNEMIAAKIPLDLYAAYMRDVHHDQPLQEEERLNAVVDTIADNARRAGSRVDMGDGTAEMGSGKKVRPIFEGVN